MDRIDGAVPETTAHTTTADVSTELTTGTTVVGLAGSDGVVIGADARASLGGRFVTNQSMQKVEPIGNRAAVAFAGGVSDAQSLVDQLRAERRLYELEHDRPSTTTSPSRRRATPLTPANSSSTLEWSRSAIDSSTANGLPSSP
ncbi:hypothetical protein [Halovivax gelatinilyticus]|uniref:hypothetical protein n=1 Tax=Halovivax gelatinilyticus TaxID=2961597 RepID=UPI0020CA6FF5|nr:hypothetical protein [Halovivax gelatinilyticus]